MALLGLRLRPFLDSLYCDPLTREARNGKRDLLHAKNVPYFNAMALPQRQWARIWEITSRGALGTAGS